VRNQDDLQHQEAKGDLSKQNSESQEDIVTVKKQTLKQPWIATLLNLFPLIMGTGYICGELGEICCCTLNAAFFPSSYDLAWFARI